jgi:hypothetical protein
VLIHCAQAILFLSWGHLPSVFGVLPQCLSALLQPPLPPPLLSPHLLLLLIAPLAAPPCLCPLSCPACRHRKEPRADAPQAEGHEEPAQEAQVGGAFLPGVAFPTHVAFPSVFRVLLPGCPAVSHTQPISWHSCAPHHRICPFSPPPPSAGSSLRRPPCGARGRCRRCGPARPPMEERRRVSSPASASLSGCEEAAGPGAAAAERRAAVHGGLGPQGRHGLPGACVLWFCMRDASTACFRRVASHFVHVCRAWHVKITYRLRECTTWAGKLVRIRNGG